MNTSRLALSVGLVTVLAVLHQDFWLWSDPTLVGGFMPVGLAYHAGFSLLATVTWAVVVLLGWPDDPVDGSEDGV